MSPEGEVAVYWDASAVLAALFRDPHSHTAQRWTRRAGVHLVSTLAWAEVYAVIARIEREHALSRILVAAGRDALEDGMWRRVNAAPEWRLVRNLSLRWPLRGADLWHLAAATSLQTELPGLKPLSFDARLVAAARGEGIGTK